MNWLEYILSQLTTEQWLIVLAASAIYVYTFMNYIVRKKYLRAAYLDDGEGFDVFPCTKSGNEITFYPEKIKKLYGVVPLQRRSVKQPITKGVAAGAKTWIRGPRTFRVYFATHNSPVTIDPTNLMQITMAGLSLGHESIHGVIKDLSEAGRVTTKRDYLVFGLLLATGMLIHIILQNAGVPI